MKLAGWKRALLAGLLTLSVAGGTFAPMVAGPAAAAVGEDKCLGNPIGPIRCLPN
jgi:acyl dehydratase